MDSGYISGSRGSLLSLGNLNLILPGTNSVKDMDMDMDMDMDESSRRRFSSMPGHIFDREHYDPQVLERKHRLTTEQVNLLEKSFQEENKLEPQRKSQLAKMLRVPPRQVAVWFQNRRARSKIKQIEREYDLLKSLYDSLREKHELVLEENEKLQSKVLTLTEKLQGRGSDTHPVTNQNETNLRDELNVKPDNNRDEDYFSEVLTAAEQQPNDEQYFDWWIWPSIAQPLW